MDHHLDNDLLRNEPPGEVAAYLRTALKDVEVKTISEHLIASVTRGAISPRIFRVWLSVCKDPLALAQALQQDVSIAARRYAMIEFAKRLRSSQHPTTWQAVGGTEGMLELFAGLSVADIGFFCKRIASCATVQVKDDSLWRTMTEFASSLAFKHFPRAKYQHQDPRPLIKYYAHLLPVCTTDFLKEWVSRLGLPSEASRRVLHSHWRYWRLFLQELEPSESAAGRPSTFQRSTFSTPLVRFVPPLPAETQGLSESMAYSMQRLEYGTVNPKHSTFDYESDGSERYFKRQIAEPLLKRAIRKKASTAVKCRILDLITQYTAARPNATKQLGLVSEPLLELTITLWSRRPEAYRERLTRLLQVIPKDARKVEYQVFEVLNLAHPQLRYELLRLMCRHLKCIDLDLENDAEVKQSKGQYLGAAIFELLPKDQSLYLLRRFLRIRPQCDFLSYQDPTDVHLKLSRGEEGHLELAKDKVEERKKYAVTARDPKNRAVGAKQSLHTATASGHQSVLGDVLLWARRFNRDVWTVKELYSWPMIQHSSVVDVLCGIPGRRDPNATVQSVKEAIIKGNDMIELLYETMCMCLAEPSFALDDWFAVQGLLETTIRLREPRVARFQDYLGLTDEETYSTIWEPTLETWLRLEAIILKEENEKLWLASPQSIVDWIDVGPCVPATLRFIDEISRCRDVLWKAHRRAVHPAVVSLPEPWPRGLPIQSLHPFRLKGKEEDLEMIVTPYVLQRATKVVFMLSSTALASVPEDEEARTAIACMVDDFEKALYVFYTGLDKDSDARKARAQKAWSHALTELTGDRMNRLEAIHFWKDHFEAAQVDMSLIDLGLPEKARPKLPTAEDSSQRIEWNPEPGFVSRLQERVLESVLIDCFLRIGDSYRKKPLEEQSFHDTTVETFVEDQPSFWKEQHKEEPAAREALMASALLFLAAKKAPGLGLFTKPFPSPQSVRFPAMFLDDAFLQRNDFHKSLAIHYLTKQVMDVPPTLLHELTQAVIRPLIETGATVSRDYIPFELVKLLAASDRPELAISIVQQLVIERPNDSSWHRHLLTPGFFRRLSADQAGDFLQGVSKIIQDRLEETAQRAAGAKKTDEPQTTPGAPIVKVTTVKMLAQLMRHADFFDPHFNVSVLSDLFANSNHIDIQVAVAESLLGMLAETDDVELKEKIFTTLEFHAVPIAGRLSERINLTEYDWQVAESTTSLPEVDQNRELDAHPMLLLLLQTKPSSPDTSAYYNRFITPALDLSTKNNMRYTALTLQKHAPHIPLSALPPTPVSPAFLPLALNNTKALEHLPAHLLNALAAMRNFFSSPPLEVISFTNHIHENFALRSSPEGVVWLFNYRNTGAVGEIGALNMFLTTSFESKRTDEEAITHELLQKQALREMETFFGMVGNSLGCWRQFLTSLRRRPRRSPVEQGLWLKWVRPVVQAVVARVEDIRGSEGWQRDACRRPAVLPDLFLARLWLLDWPMVPLSGDWEKECEVFVREVKGVVRGLVEGRFGTSWWGRFAELVGILGEFEEGTKRKVVISVGALGDGDKGEGEVVKVLRVELAAKMLGQFGRVPEGEGFRAPVREMLEGWRRSEIEEVRVAGWEARGAWEMRGEV